MKKKKEVVYKYVFNGKKEFSEKLDKNVKNIMNAIERIRKDERVINMTTAMGQLVERVELDGIQQGIQQGIKSNSIAIAKNLLDVLDVETIAIKTGLTIEEVKQIKKELLEK